MIATTISILAFVFISVSANLRLNRCYRLESVNYPGQYIRHRGYRLYKEGGYGWLYFKDSTFKVVRAINGNWRQRSLESVNYPGHYIRHSGYNGYISQCRSRLCRNDASWKFEKGLVRSRHWWWRSTLSLRSANYRGYFLRHQNARVKISPHIGTTLYRKDSSWIPRRVSC